jgi:hypothetical protein
MLGGGVALSYSYIETDGHTCIHTDPREKTLLSLSSGSLFEHSILHSAGGSRERERDILLEADDMRLCAATVFSCGPSQPHNNQLNPLSLRAMENATSYLPQKKARAKASSHTK